MPFTPDTTVQESSGPPGLLLAGHGTRNEAGRQELLTVARELARRRPDWLVEPGFLELAEPTFKQAMQRLVDRGVGGLVTVAPVILLAAGHIARDIPAEARAAAAPWPGRFRLRQAPHLGLHPQIVELAACRYRQTCRRFRHPQDDTRLLLVGRGSTDPKTTEEFAAFARALAAACDLPLAHACFVALAEPSLQTALEEAARSTAGRIVAQPHLLFQGELMDRVETTVAQWASRYPNQEWLVGGHLGPDPRLIEALSDLASAGIDFTDFNG